MKIAAESYQSVSLLSNFISSGTRVTATD